MSWWSFGGVNITRAIKFCLACTVPWLLDKCLVLCGVFVDIKTALQEATLKEFIDKNWLWKQPDHSEYKLCLFTHSHASQKGTEQSASYVLRPTSFYNFQHLTVL